MKPKNVVIIGAAGRDFHNFNTHYRDNPTCNVVAFTAAQIPDIADRRYPAALTGRLYPKGVPIYAEADLPNLIRKLKVDDCVFSYSDVSYQHVMDVAAVVQAAGANFVLLGPNATMLKSSKPVISVGAVRTGCGKSQTSRRIIEILMARGLKVVAVRHPMPYGDIAAQKVQRFAKLSDLKKNKCTIEEMEEYEPHLVRGNVIYSGVDYEAILWAAENDPRGCDVILWDGGNNDFSFFRPDLQVTVLDPHRPGHEMSYYPGNVTLRLADVVVINKIDSADAAGIDVVRRNIAAVSPQAVVVDAASVIQMGDPAVVRGKHVLAVEDGPTVTHGEMKIGAAVVAARKFGAAGFVDPRPYLVGRLRDTFRTYPGIGTPIDLNRVIKIKKPNTRVFYHLQEIGKPDLADVIGEFTRTHQLDCNLSA
jgi:predicted GTPase